MLHPSVHSRSGGVQPPRNSVLIQRSAPAKLPESPSHRSASIALAKLIRDGRFANVILMSEPHPEQVRESLELLYRADSGRILATLIRLLGDFDLAEEAMHEAFAAALADWLTSGVPANPRPWLISTARFKAIDTLRRRARFDASQLELMHHLEARTSSAEAAQQEQSIDAGLEDDRLRLIFTCCHPSLAPEARVALTLREVCGLTTEQIAGVPYLSAHTGSVYRPREIEDP